MLAGAIVCFMCANMLSFGVLANVVENFSQGKIGGNFMPSFDDFSIWDDVVHPFFVFDDSGKKAIGVAIEKAHIVVSRDGNRFSGKWTQDNYDFSGNVLAGTHSEGPTSGTRIAPGLPFPFPFPH